MAQNTQQPLMGVKSAQDQLCALASQFTSLAGLGDHSDPELQRYLAIRITDVIRRELVQRGAIQPDQQPTIWEGGPRLDLPEQSAVNTLNPATVEDEEIAIRTEAMPDRSQTDEEDMDMSGNADRNYVVGLSQEVFAAKLHKCILDASDNNLKTVEPQFTTTLPMVERLGPLMVKALTTYWDKELRQAEAALAATGEPRQALETLGLAEYCRQPRILAERDNAGDFDGAVMSIKDIVQAQEDVTYTRQGMKSWVWPLLEKYCIKTDQRKAVEIGNEELLYMALGERFPRGYGEYKLSQQTIEAHGLFYQRPAGKVVSKNKASHRWRGRRRNYYRCLSWLRTEGHSWVFMVNVRNLDSLFGQISDPEATFGPWIEFFGSFPAELSLRALSRANGDYSGRREMRLFKNVPQTERDEWNDYRVVWKHFTELVAFQSNTEVMADMEKRAFIDLPSMEKTLKYGYCGFRDDNYSWSITIRDDEEGGLGAFSTVPIKAGSFLGFLPGYCRFSPEKENRMEVEGFIESHLLGLFFEDQGCCGLPSYMKRTNLGAEGNVIGGWEQYNDDMDGNPMPWCIVIFAYRDIPALTPLVFWDHMRFD